MSISSVLSEKKTIAILLLLAIGPNHLRGINRILGGSLSTISSRMNSLVENGLVKASGSKPTRVFKLTTKGRGIASFIKTLDSGTPRVGTSPQPSMSMKLILTLVYALGGTIRGSTRMEKLVFILQQKESFKTTYKFIPQIFGPYSKEIMEDARLLQAAGLLEIDEEPFESWDLSDWVVVRRDYVLTEEGKQVAKEFFSEWNNQGYHNDTILELQRFNSMSLNSLLKFVHEEYPEYNKSSVY